jgi:type IV pilus assembly protein PilO
MDQRIEKVLKLPNKQKIVILIAILMLESIALFWGLYLPRQKEMKAVQSKLDTVRVQVDETRKIANNLPRFKREYEDLNQELQKALTELPNQKEIPSLLTSITTAGKDSGLDFLVFRPKSEEPKDFYAVVPVDITVSGNYYSVANFFGAVSRLSRIVNISNVAFSDIKPTGDRTHLKVTCLATTFRFLDKKENKDETKKK